MKITSILKTRAASWVNLEVVTSIDRKERDFVVLYYLQSADTVRYIFNNIFVGIIEEQCSDQGERKWKC